MYIAWAVPWQVLVGLWLNADGVYKNTQRIKQINTDLSITRHTIINEVNKFKW